nr:DUF1612 domain-containing protein [Sinorhizobium meliloti]
MREAGPNTAAHLAAIIFGLKSIPVEAVAILDATPRLLAPLDGLTVAAELGLKERDRLALARQMLERRLVDRRSSSNLPGLIELVVRRWSRPAWSPRR